MRAVVVREVMGCFILLIKFDYLININDIVNYPIQSPNMTT
jgi:hypothetical protein